MLGLVLVLRINNEKINVGPLPYSSPDNNDKGTEKPIPKSLNLLVKADGPLAWSKKNKLREVWPEEYPADTTKAVTVVDAISATGVEPFGSLMKFPKS